MDWALVERLAGTFGVPAVILGLMVAALWKWLPPLVNRVTDRHIAFIDSLETQVKDQALCRNKIADAIDTMKDCVATNTTATKELSKIVEKKLVAKKR